MKGQTNALVKGGGASSYENLNVTLTSNQSDKSELVGAVVTVSYDGNTEQQTWEGTNLVFQIPNGKEYSVGFSEIADYRTPDTLTRTAVAGNSYVAVPIYQSELAVVTVSSDSGSSVAGQVVSINGNEHTLDDSGVCSQKVAFGVTYEISVSEFENHDSPSVKTRTAKSSIYEVSVIYTQNDENVVVNVSATDGSDVDGQTVSVVNAEKGVYILDTTGRFWAASNWDGTATADCIAVVDGVHAFGIALYGYGSAIALDSSNTNTLEDYMTAISDASSAKTDYDGPGNTSNILKMQAGANYAAGWSNAFTFPSGEKGYMPAYGEWAIAYNYKDLIDAALVACGGTEMETGYHWCSTYYGDDKNWVFRWSDGANGPVSKSATHRNRAFRSIPLEYKNYVVTNGEASFKMTRDTLYTVSVNEREGYKTPLSQTFTAVGGNSRVVDMLYIANGVWIKDTEGRYWSSDSWDGSATADCVAVVSGSHKFGISILEEDWVLPISSSSTTAIETYMTAITDEASAKVDYNGEENTANIIKLEPSNSYAAGYCNTYAFPSGEVGYLPSLGEWWLAYNNKEAVDLAISACGGTAINTDTYYWASTYYGILGSNNDRCCWILQWSDGSASCNKLASSGQKVRAFCSL